MTVNAASGVSRPRRSWIGRGLLLALMGMAVAGVSAHAANRTVEIVAPASVEPGSKVDITITASTDVGGKEHVGFFHADYSTNGGATWTGICYTANEGASAMHTATFTAGAAGSKAIVRVRVAFRGGKAGDVDLAGQPIAWDTTWSKWVEPPARFAYISVQAG